MAFDTRERFNRTVSQPNPLDAPRGPLSRLLKTPLKDMSIEQQTLAIIGIFSLALTAITQLSR